MSSSAVAQDGINDAGITEHVTSLFKHVACVSALRLMLSLISKRIAQYGVDALVVCSV